MAKCLSFQVTVPGILARIIRLKLPGYGASATHIYPLMLQKVLDATKQVNEHFDSLGSICDVPQSLGTPIVFKWPEQVSAALTKILDCPPLKEMVDLPGLQSSSELIAETIVGNTDLVPAVRKMNLAPIPDVESRLIKANEKLPIIRRLKDLLNDIDRHQVTVIRAGTGSGKSTVIPAAIMARGGRVVVTQPRRIAALSIAERISTTLNLPIGDKIGYRMRHSSKPIRSYGPGVEFVTTGSLLQIMRSSPNLSAYTHIIIDEAHESSVENDLSMALMLSILKQRRDLKLVIMSATIDEALFSKYYASRGLSVATPYAVETKRPFDVKKYTLDDIDLRKFGGNIPKAEKDFIFDETSNNPPRHNAESSVIPYNLMANLTYQLFRKSPGVTLIFLPGWSEISEMERTIRRTNPGIQLDLHALHGIVILFRCSRA
jgi:HrpA-like RNA helicase